MASYRGGKETILAGAKSFVNKSSAMEFSGALICIFDICTAQEQRSGDLGYEDHSPSQ